MYKSNSGLGLNPNHYCSYISILLTEKLICVNPLLLLYLPLCVTLRMIVHKQNNRKNECIFLSSCKTIFYLCTQNDVFTN